MGLFGNLFRKDMEQELARVEGYLEREEPYKALELAGRLARSADEPHRQRARELEARAREALLGSILERATAAEAEGKLADAADWLEGALQRLDGEDPRAGEIAGRLAALRQRIEDEAGEVWAERAEGPRRRPDAGGGSQVEAGDHYQALVAMLDEAVADRYEGRSPAFQQALVDLNEGRAEAALPVLDLAVEADPGDPIPRLERGRCRLVCDDPEGARTDFEAAWEELGDDPLDLSGTLSVPDLWADAVLATDQPTPVLERLAELAAPGAGRPTLTESYATALLAAGRAEEARALLGRAVSRYPERPVFPFLLARALRACGEPGLARECLETSVAPSCATGRCGAPRRHPPSLRLLAELQLAEGGRPERALELLTLLSQDQGGALTVRDLRLLADYQRQAGNEAAAGELVAEAERLAAAGEERTDADYVPPALGAGRRSVL